MPSPAELSNEPLRSGSAIVSRSPPLPRISLRRALAFPFTQRNWPQALGYIGAIQFLPIVGFLIIRGWRFDIARRVGSNDSKTLPDWRDAKEHLKQGTLLFCVTQFYFLPMYAALLWPRSGVFWSVVELITWTYRYFVREMPTKTLWEVVEPGLKSLAIFVAIIVLVPPVISGIVESATQRYAQTGRVWSLFQVWRNLLFAWDDLYDVVRIELCILGLWIAVAIVSLLLVMTIGGTIFIPPVMLPIYMWTRGCLMGQWIWKNRLEGEEPG